MELSSKQLLLGMIGVGVHHVGIRVKSLSNSIGHYERMGYVGSNIIHLEQPEVDVVFMRNTIGEVIELVKPRNLLSKQPTMHLAFHGKTLEARNYLRELGRKLSQNGEDGWVSIPELGIRALFFKGPGGEPLELVDVL